jgi:hypothetical protein
MFATDKVSSGPENKAKMARQRDPAGMEKPPGCEPDGL